MGGLWRLPHYLIVMSCCVVWWNDGETFARTYWKIGWLWVWVVCCLLCVVLLCGILDERSAQDTAHSTHEFSCKLLPLQFIRLHRLYVTHYRGTQFPCKIHVIRLGLKSPFRSSKISEWDRTEPSSRIFRHFDSSTSFTSLSSLFTSLTRGTTVHYFSTEAFLDFTWQCLLRTCDWRRRYSLAKFGLPHTVVSLAFGGNSRNCSLE